MINLNHCDIRYECPTCGRDERRPSAADIQAKIQEAAALPPELAARIARVLVGTSVLVGITIPPAAVPDVWGTEMRRILEACALSKWAGPEYPIADLMDDIIRFVRFGPQPMGYGRKSKPETST